ncbi:transposase [Streptomyces sp. NBC_00190]|uniref:hypothetical protein n=1 Tax=unclassified Streptomyces TaxID=2593676 RepID=UPI002E2ABFAF|nr:hypothetical protein [Streptomyces sp. NBC_00190]WSZ38090.1 transposase [Streptomyces sp. NBC_00868]
MQSALCAGAVPAFVEVRYGFADPLVIAVVAAGLKRYEAEHDWLTAVRLPPYAPDLNPSAPRTSRPLTTA